MPVPPIVARLFGLHKIALSSQAGHKTYFRKIKTFQAENKTFYGEMDNTMERLLRARGG